MRLLLQLLQHPSAERKTVVSSIFNKALSLRSGWARGNRSIPSSSIQRITELIDGPAGGCASLSAQRCSSPTIVRPRIVGIVRRPRPANYPDHYPLEHLSRSSSPRSPPPRRRRVVPAAGPSGGPDRRWRRPLVLADVPPVAVVAGFVG